jgi:bla regulator protein blaR1
MSTTRNHLEQPVATPTHCVSERRRVNVWSERPPRNVSLGWPRRTAALPPDRTLLPKPALRPRRTPTPMAPLCLFYFFAVGSWLGAAGLLVERALPPAASRRWIWCVTLVSSVALPMLLSATHSSHVIGLWGHEVVRVPAAHQMAAAGTASTLRAWLDCTAGFGAVLLRIWLAGTLLVLGWAAASTWRVHHMLRSSGARRGAAQTTLIDGVPVTVTDRVGPATAGFWRSRVLLPRWVLALPATQQRYVVRHEDEHRRARDVALLGVASVIVALMPWNLALWWQLRRLRLAVEMDCDARVVASLGGPAEYGELLLTVATAASRGPRLQPALLGAGMLERRLVALVAPRRRRITEWLAAVTAAVALVAMVLSVPHPQMAREANAHVVATGTSSGSPPPSHAR